MLAYTSKIYFFRLSSVFSGKKRGICNRGKICQVPVMFDNLKLDLYAILATSMVVCMPTMYFLQLFAICQGIS